jgi:hypothetical protein
MEFDCQNQLEDYRLANRAHRRAKWNRKRAAGVIGWVACIVLSVMLYLLLKKNTVPVAGQPLVSTPTFSVGAWAIVFFLIWPLIFLYLRGKQYDRAWAGQPNEHLLKHWQVNDAGVVVDSGHSRSEIGWPAFRRYLETPALFMLYVSEFSFHMIPKRAFADEAQIEEFRDLLRRHIQPQTQAFPVIAPVEKEQTPL